MIYLLNVSPRPLEITMLDSSRRVIKVNDGFTVEDAQFVYYRCFAVAGFKAVSKEEFCKAKGIKLAEPVVEKKVETKEEKPKVEEKPKEEVKEPEKPKEETKEPEKVENTEEKPKRGRKPKEETAEN